MNKRLKTYLRPLRRSSGLTQRELAYLIGRKDGSCISRVERFERVPTLVWTRACTLVFGTRAFEIFPELFAEVREGVLYRANDLYEQLQGNPSKAARAKLDFL